MKNEKEGKSQSSSTFPPIKNQITVIIS